MGNGNKPYLKTRQDGYTLERNIVGDKQAGESEKPPRRNWDSPRRLEGQERGNQSGISKEQGLQLCNKFLLLYERSAYVMCSLSTPHMRNDI